VEAAEAGAVPEVAGLMAVPEVAGLMAEPDVAGVASGVGAAAGALEAVDAAAGAGGVSLLLELQAATRAIEARASRRSEVVAFMSFSMSKKGQSAGAVPTGEPVGSSTALEHRACVRIVQLLLSADGDRMMKPI
jgi:hypothetical protein